MVLCNLQFAGRTIPATWIIGLVLILSITIASIALRACRSNDDDAAAGAKATATLASVAAAPATAATPGTTAGPAPPAAQEAGSGETGPGAATALTATVAGAVSGPAGQEIGDAIDEEAASPVTADAVLTAIAQGTIPALPGQNPAGTSVPPAGPEATAAVEAVLTAVAQGTIPALPGQAATTATPTIVVAATPTATATIAPCGPVPGGWQRYVVQPGDTLSELALAARVSMTRLMEANCLTNSDLLAGQSLFLPLIPEPTPTACTSSPPFDWTPYTVRGGDTLFALAITRGTSAAQIMASNCLASSMILVGQSLFLPPLAEPGPPPPAVAVQPGATSVGDCTLIGCGRRELPGFTAAAGRPDEGFEPCTDGEAGPRLSHLSEKFPNFSLQPGQHDYYFACGFPEAAQVVAQISGPGGFQEELSVSGFPPVPNLNMGQSQGVAVWNAPCTLQAGFYQVTLQDDQGNRAQPLQVHVRPRFQQIMAVPQRGSPGLTFEISYCGYRSEASRPVVIDLYYVMEERVDGSLDLRHDVTWPVIINADGWAIQPLPSLRNAPKGRYLIVDRGDRLKGEEYLWLE